MFIVILNLFAYEKNSSVASLATVLFKFNQASKDQAKFCTLQCIHC